MTKFKKDDKVKLAHPNNIPNFNGYSNKRKEFWYSNDNIIFIINSILAYKSFNTRYILNYPNGEMVMSPVHISCTTVFFDEELELYTNMLPDELFEM